MQHWFKDMLRHASKTASTAMYTIILVIKQFTHDGTDNHERFMQIGMPTYETYLDNKSLKQFIVIAPEEELADLSKKLLAKWPKDKMPWVFVSEDKLIDNTIASGWARQQTAKLAVSMIVTTDHYLIIDDDTYLTRPFSEADLKDTDGKLIWNRTRIDFPFFFLWSNQVLKYDFNNVQKEEYHMAITPEVFVTSEVRSLVKWLVSEYGDARRWQKVLADHKYTEYCMYWIWLIKNNKHTTLYSTLPINECTSVYAYETSSEGHNLTERINNSFKAAPKKHFFSFVQSSLGYPVDHVRGLIRGACPDIA